MAGDIATPGIANPETAHPETAHPETADTHIANPDFAEPGVGPAPKHKAFTTKNADGIPGWEVTQDAVRLVALAPGDRPAGSSAGQALRLGGEDTQAGAVSQTVPTTAGRRTAISWMESPDIADEADRGSAGQAQAEQEYTVLVRPVEAAKGPGVTKEAFVPAGAAGPAWSRRCVEFIPTGSNVTVEFAAARPGALAPLITGLTLTAGGAPPPQPVALYGTATGSPLRAEPGGTVRLTFTVGSRAADAVPGEKVTAALRPQPPLAPAPGSPGTVAFAGSVLTAGGPPQEGVFEVTVPPGTAPGSYQAVADLAHDGAPLAHGTLAWAIEVVHAEAAVEPA